MNINYSSPQLSLSVKAIYMHRMYILLKNGLSLAQALHFASEDGDIKHYIDSDVTIEVVNALNDGSHPEDELKKLNIFSDYELALIRSGLETNSLSGLFYDFYEHHKVLCEFA